MSGNEKDKLSSVGAGRTINSMDKGERDTVPAPGLQKRTGVVKVRSLHVRKEHNANAEVVATLKSGDEVIILETWTDGRNTWARIGEGQWAAMVYNGETCIE